MDEHLRQLLAYANWCLEKARKATEAKQPESANRYMDMHEGAMAQYNALEARGARTAGGPHYRASLSNIVGAVLSGNPTEGAERELQEERGLDSHQVPLELLQTRAVTPAPADTQANQQPIVPAIFPEGVAEFLGVSKPTVPVGEAVYPVLTTGASPEAVAPDAKAGESTGAFTASKLEPTRLQTNFRVRREDLATFSMMEEALRGNLSMALSSALDDRILYDAGGLLNGGLGNAPDAPMAAATWADFLAAVTAQVDGRYASMPSQVRLLIGSATYQAAEAVASTARHMEESGFETMARKSGGVRITSRIAAPASTGGQDDIQDALAARRLSAMHAVCPIWEGVTLIRDEVTQAAQGQILLTAVMLYRFAVLRGEGFARLRFKTA